jgi:IrrE N-terminal-like domain
VIVARAEAGRQAQTIARWVEATHPGALTRLRDDALTEVTAWSEVQVQRVPDLDLSDGCSVAGSYRGDTNPPTLCTAWSASRGRRQFTVLHELAHHIQRSVIEIAVVLMQSPDPDGLEEAACNLFAAQTLLPDDIVDQYVGQRGPNATEVADLFAGSGASRAACCVRAADRLRGPGAVVLLDRDGIVSFAQPSGGFIPPARGSDQSGTPLVSAALRRRGQARAQTFVRYRTGGRSDTVYGDCADASGWLVAVLAADRVPWQKFSPPQPGTGSGGARWWTCETCGEVFPTTGQCPACAQPKCPQAGHCGCTTAHVKTCESCYMEKHRSQFEAGGRICRECRE